jgi:hypothetical protein
LIRRRPWQVHAVSRSIGAYVVVAVVFQLLVSRHGTILIGGTHHYKAEKEKKKKKGRKKKKSPQLTCQGKLQLFLRSHKDQKGREDLSNKKMGFFSKKIESVN